MASEAPPSKALLVPDTLPIPGYFPDSDDDAAAVYFDAPSRPCSPSLSSSHRYSIDDLKHELENSRKGWLEIMELFSSHEGLPSTDAVTIFQALQVSMDISRVAEHLEDDDYENALCLAKMTLKPAKRLNNEVLLARCYYWMGRCHFQLQNYHEAYRYFEQARPCSNDEHCLEAFDLDDFLKQARSRFDEEDRATDRVNAMLEAIDQKDSATLRFDTKPSKRKREVQTWDLVLRMVPKNNSSRQPTQKKGKGERIEARVKQQAWMIHDTEDLPQYPKTASKTKDVGVNAEGLKWHQAQQSHPPLPGCPFTYRCWLNRLAPRIRHTKIFSEHACETILTPLEWRFLQKLTTGRRISLDWLARERRTDQGVKMGRIKRTNAPEKLKEMMAKWIEKRRAEQKKRSISSLCSKDLLI